MTSPNCLSRYVLGRGSPFKGLRWLRELLGLLWHHQESCFCGREIMFTVLYFVIWASEAIRTGC